MKVSQKALFLLVALLLPIQVLAQKPAPPAAQKPVFPITENMKWTKVRDKDYPPDKDPDGEVKYHRAIFYRNTKGDISKVEHLAFGELASEVYDIQKSEGEIERWVRLRVGLLWSAPELYGNIFKKVLRDGNGKITGVIFFLKDEFGDTKRSRVIERPRGK